MFIFASSLVEHDATWKQEQLILMSTLTVLMDQSNLA